VSVVSSENMKRSEEAQRAHRQAVHATREGTKKLKEFLSRSIAAVGSLFALWDVNGDGQITPMEWRSAVLALGVDVPPHVCDIVFAEFDPDGSGTVSYTEFLRYALRDALASSATRVMDFFHKVDVDGSGEIGVEEFRLAVRSVGLDVPREHLDAIFVTMDEDKSGTISFREFHKQLRQGSAIKLGKKLRVGGAGKIRMSTTERFNTEEVPGRPPPRTPQPAARVAAAPRPITAPALAPPPSHLLSSLLPPPTAPSGGFAATAAPLGVGAWGGRELGEQTARPPSLLRLSAQPGGGLRLAAVASSPGRTRHVKPGGGGGPRPHDGTFVGFASRGMVVCDEKRRRTIQDEKIAIAAQRVRGPDLVFRQRTITGFRGHSWSEPLPLVITPEGLPTWTWSAIRSAR
jgi:Ca2+-binding EF-hand superfamily protein